MDFTRLYYHVVLTMSIQFDVLCQKNFTVLLSNRVSASDGRGVKFHFQPIQKFALERTRMRSRTFFNADVIVLGESSKVAKSLSPYCRNG